MKRLTKWTALGVLGLWAGSSLRAQDLTVDTTGVGALIEQGMHHSEAMQNLEHLTDIIGPRLTGSPAARAANDWMMQRLQGLRAGRPSGVLGVRRHLVTGPTMWMRMTSPRRHDVIAASWVLDRRYAGGKQTVAGPVVLINAANADSLEAYKGKVRGAWLMLRAPANVWNNDGPPMTAADWRPRCAAASAAPGQGTAARFGRARAGRAVPRGPSLICCETWAPRAS